MKVDVARWEFMHSSLMDETHKVDHGCQFECLIFLSLS